MDGSCGSLCLIDTEGMHFYWCMIASLPGLADEAVGHAVLIPNYEYHTDRM